MPEWCYNSVTFESNEKSISALTKIWEDMIDRANATNMGVIPINQEASLDNYFFNPNILDKSKNHLEVTYNTRYTQNPLNLNLICIKFGIEDMYGHFSEDNNKVYGEYKFENNTFYIKELTDEEHDKCMVLKSDITDEILKYRKDYPDEEEWDEITEEENTCTDYIYEMLDDTIESKPWVKLKT